MMSNTNPDPVAEPAFWTIPGSATTVTYSLPLFQEIESQVNEAYRKIPHGGIEVGGLLFGSIKESGPAVDAFRGIECEHAFGPSLLLSERDLSALEAQIQSAASDPELEGMQLVGWFLARNRGPLHLTDPELALVDRFFPLPGQLTVLVKPERYQPTLFGFLVREAHGNMGRDASRHAIVLPVASRQARPVASAGSMPTEAVASLPTPKSGARSRPGLDEPASPNPDAGPDALPIGRQGELKTEEPPSTLNRTEQDSPKTAEIRDAVRRLKSEEARLIAEREEALTPAGPLPPTAPPAVAKPPELEPEPDYLRELGARASATDLPRRNATPPVKQEWDYLSRESSVASSSRLFLVLSLAALAGGVVGYLAYLQIPSPIISLNARGLAQSVLISWPPAETRNAVYAAIRVDDSAPVPLSPEEKASGELELSATADMKVELITRNWMRDSRGIVRYVKAAPRAKSSAPPALER